MGSGTAAKRTLTRVQRPGERPPSVDSLARSIADTGLPHPILVDVARAAIAAGDAASARARADEFRRTLLSPVVNATGVVLDFRKWTFINADLTISLARQPVGEWILLDGETWVGPEGAGLATARLGDSQGYFGRAVQSLVVARR